MNPSTAFPRIRRRPRLPRRQPERLLPGQRPARPSSKRTAATPATRSKKAGCRKRKNCSKAGASSSPRTRSASCSSAPKGPSTSAAATARPTNRYTGLRPAAGTWGHRPQPLRRPARPGRGDPEPDVRIAGRIAALPEPETAERRDPPYRPRHRRPLRRQPAARERRRKRRTDRRQGLPQPLPLHHRPPDRRDLHRQRRLLGDRGDRPLRRPPGPALQLRLALLRGNRAPIPISETRPRSLQCPLQSRGRRETAELRTLLQLQPRPVGRPRRRMPLRIGLGDQRPRLLRGDPAFEPVRRRAFLRRRGSRLHLGDDRRRRRQARPVDDEAVHARGQGLPGGEDRRRSRRLSLLRQPLQRRRRRAKARSTASPTNRTRRSRSSKPNLRTASTTAATNSPPPSTPANRPIRTAIRSPTNGTWTKTASSRSAAARKPSRRSTPKPNS